MPIYEYKGQQYELSTTDPAEAKAKILSYLEKQGAPATPKPTPAVAPTSPVAAATAALAEPSEGGTGAANQLPKPSIGIGDAIRGLGYKSALSGFNAQTAPAPGTTYPISQQFVDNVLNEVIAPLPLEKRVPALRELARASGPYGAAAKVLLERARLENLPYPGREADEALYKKLAKAPRVQQPSARGVAPTPLPVSLPDITPAISDIEEGTSAEDIAARRAFVADMTARRAADASSSARQEAYLQEASSAYKRKFAEENPLLGSLASGSASLLSGTINIPSVSADFFNQSVVNPVLTAFGFKPLARVPTAFGTEYLTRAASDFMPRVGAQEMGEAWNKNQFAPWLMSKLAANSPQMAQSLAAAFIPPLRAVFLPTVAGTAAGQSFVEGDDSRIAAAKGMVEYATEKLPLQAFDKIGEVLKKMGPSKTNTVLAVAGQKLLLAGGAVTANSLVNAIEETAAQLGGNVLDKYFQGKDIELSKGLAEAAVVGAATGAAMSTPQVAGIALSPGRQSIERRLIEELDKEADARDAQNQLATQGAQDVSKPVERPSGTGVSVAGEPAGGAAPGGVAPSEPSGMVPPATDVGQPPAGEGAGPGAVGNQVFDLTGWTESPNTINKKTGKPIFPEGTQRFTKEDELGKHTIILRDGKVSQSRTMSKPIRLVNSAIDFDAPVTGSIDIDHGLGLMYFVPDDGAPIKMSPRAVQMYQAGESLDKIAELEFSDAGGIRPDGTRTPHTTIGTFVGAQPTSAPAGEGAGPGAVVERDLEGRIEPRIDLEAVAPTAAAPTPGVTAYGQKLRAMTDEELKDEDDFGFIFNSAEENEILKAEVARRKSEQTGPEFDASTSVNAQQTPLLPYIEGINPQLDAFYNDLYSKPLAELPEALQRYRSLLDGANNALSFIEQRLATWNHPAIQFKTPAQRAEAKSKASAEDRELLDIQSEIAGAATRLASQAMALHKGYKGKKTGSQEKIDAADKQIEKDFKRAFGLMYSRGLLTDEDAAAWEEEQKRKAAPAPAGPKTKQQILETATDAELARAMVQIGESEVSFLSPTEIQAEIDRRKAAAAAAPAVTEKRVKDEFGNAATEVTLPNGSVYTIQRLNATESMGLPGWHLAGATATDIREGSFLGNTKQEAIQELTRREQARAPVQAESVPPQTAPVDKPEPSANLNTPESPVDSVTPPPVEDKPYYGSDEINALGDRIKTAVDKITSDFMVGDMVRYGNVNGVVVGVDDSYVRVHPDGAKSPKAYYRVPKSSVQLVARPDTTSKTAAMALPGEDKKFGTEQGKLNADMGGLIQLLGANMYASSVAEVTVKELLQNAFDAVKGAVSGKKAPSLYKSGNITITFNDAERTITITDDARGMTPEIVRNAFFTVAGSDKSDLAPEDRSGGLGLAKMGFMMGSERLILDTVRDGVRVRVDTNAKDIANSNFQLIKTPAPKGEHGTSVTVKIPEFYIDPKTGEQRSIYFSANPKYYDALQQPLIGPVTVNVVRAGYGDSTETLPVGLNFPADKYVQFKVNFGWGSADIYFSKERNPSSSTWDIKHQVLSSGVYQFNTDFKLSPQEKIPYDIIVNIKSSVEAKHPDYPFENSRERFKKRLEADIVALQTYLAQIARGNEAQDLQENFKNIVSMPRIEVGKDIVDASTKLRKAFDQRGTSERRELPPMPKEVTVSGTQVVATDTGRVLADTAKKEEKQAKETFKAEREAPEMKDFLLQMAQNPNQPIFHNNTNVDLLEVGRPYGNPEQFFAELGTLMVEMKEALANSGIYGYEVLKPENLFFGGVSVDKGYGGVHIKVPYKAVLVNPFYDFGAKTLSGVRRFLLTTMIHEIAHTGDMSHGVGHNTQMARVEQYLEDEALYNYFEDALLDLLMRHESTFTAMREAYGRSTTKNTAKSLKDYEEGSASESVGRDSSSSEDELRAISASRGPRGDGAIRTAGPLDTTSGIPRATGSTAPTSVKGLHQDVVDAINRNDIRGALQAIARNTSGLYSELARRLATLNLPTSIIFNNARALVKQIIDDRSAQQQIRLFAYLSREAPAFYDKYFKDYDKSENLERVAEGLAKVESAGINLAPVNTELAAVQDAYRKNLPGLTAPGFFAPTLDVVNISPDAKFGSNYRVVLHEIVHAATEYMLFSDFYKIGLTPEQSQAIADLYEMYNYAQTKIPPGEYGFTKISEFVAEIMTNPKFQAKLKGIPYKREKTSLFNSFVRYVGKLFGLRNLTGAAMSAVNDIMSPQRPTVIKPSPLRFAPKGKRVRGPISKPDTWRTAEAVETSIKDVIADATTGRVSAADAIKDLTGALWSATGTGVRFVVLPLLQLRQLKDLVRTRLPQLTGGVDIVEQMVAYRGKSIKSAEEITQNWSALQRKNPRQSGLMGRIMLEATIRGRDPDDGVPSGAAPDALDNAWNALKPEFKQLYRDTRDFYADAIKAMVRTMKQRALGLPKAERQAMIRKINEQFGPDKLVKPYFPLRRFGTHWFQIGKGDFKEFYTFESAIARNLAFSKRRRQLLAGNAQQRTAADTMRMGDGISELFSQNVATTQVLRNMEDIVDGLTATSTDALKAEIKDSINQLIYLLLPEQSMRKMFINRKAIQGASGDMLRVFAKTAVHSAYQQARFKYAEPFLNNVNNARGYVDELETSHAITPQQGAVYRDFVQELERRTKTVLGVEDTSPIARVAGAITNTTFFFTLSAPASALLNIVGMATLTMPRIGARYGYAKTNALMLKNLGLYGATMPKRSLAPLATGNFMQVSFPSIVEGANLSPLLKRAADRFVDDGDINISMTNDIFEMSELPSALYTGKTNTVKKIMAGLFHQAERLNREVALMTVFELAYDKFLNADRKDIKGVVERDPATNQPLKYTPDEAFGLAIQEARDIAGLTLGDYTRQMKGRIFTIPSVNVIAQFKQYAITATYNILRDHYLSIIAPFRKAEIEQFRQQMIKDGLSPSVIDQRLDEAEAYRKEIYRESWKRLAGVLGMTFMFGGLVAQPFFSMLGELISMFAPDDDDEFYDWQNGFYNFMENEVGGAAAAIFTKMGMDAAKSERYGIAVGEALARGPVATITGTSLADRVSLDLKNLWWREGRYSPDARETLQSEVIANLGPSVGLALNWADAWQLAGEGQWARAFEKAAPALLAKPVTAFRLGTEGATTSSGVVIGQLYPEQFTTWELAMQAIGFQPEKLAQAQKAAIQTNTYEQKIEYRRNALLNRLWMERNTPGYVDALQKAREFSLLYPQRAIDYEEIARSFAEREEAKARAEAIGAKLDEKLLGRTAPMLRYGMQ